MKKKVLSVLALALMLWGCNVAQDMRKVAEKQEKLQVLLKEKHGWDTQVGWNIHNGVLNKITVMFSADQIRQETVSNLEAVTKEAVISIFHERPRSVVIEIFVAAQ